MRRISGYLVTTCIVIAVAWALTQVQPDTVRAQVRISDTPVPVIIPSSTPLPTDIAAPTATATATSPIEDTTRIIARVNPGDINVRDEPDTTGNRLGSMESDREYAATGRYFNWIQFQYSTDRQAWVYADLVDVVGQLSDVPVVDPYTTPTANPQQSIGTSTAQAQLQAPGGAQTATAESRVLSVPTQNADSNPEGYPPTYTPPPNLVERQPTAVLSIAQSPTPPAGFLDDTLLSVREGRLPPVIPILLLSGFGLFGLLVAVLRR
jgi:hypothetical protein